MGPHAQPLLPGHIIDWQRDWSMVPRREPETTLYLAVVGVSKSERGEKGLRGSGGGQ